MQSLSVVYQTFRLCGREAFIKTFGVDSVYIKQICKKDDKMNKAYIHFFITAPSNGPSLLRDNILFAWGAYGDNR